MSSHNNLFLVAPSQVNRISQRNVAILSMILNRIGVPDVLQEFVIALYATGNWDRSDWDEISLMRMARRITSNPEHQNRALRRLRDKCPEFFRWQDGQYFKIVERRIIEERTETYKTKVRYNLLIYKDISKVMEIPPDSLEKDVRSKVEEVFFIYPQQPESAREPRIRSKKSLSRSMIRALNKYVDRMGGPDMAAMELSDVIEEAKNLKAIEKFLQLLCQMRGF